MLALSGRHQPMFENHVHPEMLDRFDEGGRRAGLGLVACLLRHRPEVLGLMGTSWFYDEAVGRLSPRLAYLREVPLRHGAIFLSAETTEDAAKSALSRSATRRQAAEEGRYRPRNVTLLWPRKSLLASSVAR
jgi:hypothetical protein